MGVYSSGNNKIDYFRLLDFLDFFSDPISDLQIGQVTITIFDFLISLLNFFSQILHWILLGIGINNPLCIFSKVFLRHKSKLVRME